MNRRLTALAAGLVAGIAATTPPAIAREPEAAGGGARPAAGDPVDVIRLEQGPDATHLEVATIRCRRPDGAVVDLVGAIHIADRAYFESLNERFRTYDAVLFEMVGGDGDMAAKLADPPDHDHPIRFFQVLLKNALGLDFQVDAIDYTAPNFVHADMTLEEFESSRSEAGETLGTVVQRVFEELADAEPAAGAAAAGDADPAADPLASMLSFDGLFGLLTGQATADAVKRDLAAQLADAERLFHLMEGEEGSVILGQRNRKAVDIVRRELEAGRRNLAVFYGAAHLPGIAALLEGDLGFSRDAATWTPAWTVPADNAEPESPSPANTTPAAAADESAAGDPSPREQP